MSADATDQPRSSTSTAGQRDRGDDVAGSKPGVPGRVHAAEVARIERAFHQILRAPLHALHNSLPVTPRTLSKVHPVQLAIQAKMQCSD